MTAQQDTRVCKTCKVEKPLDQFPINRSSKGVYYRGQCRPCFYARHGRQARPVREVAEPEITAKACVTCGKVKPVKSFRAQRDKRRGKTYVHDQCRACWKPASRTTEGRRQERALAAIRLGKPYRAAGRHGSRKTIRKLQVMLCLEAHRAWREWIMSRAPDAEVAAIYADKPWANPRLSKTERYRLRVQADPEFALVQRMRRRLRKAIWGKVSPGTFQETFGYTPADLKAHLEERFAPGMSWHNMGEWHIDHIIPVAAFDQTDPDQFRRCWALSNLQPLWGPENCSKGAKMDWSV